MKAYCSIGIVEKADPCARPRRNSLLVHVAYPKYLGQMAQLLLLLKSCLDLYDTRICDRIPHSTSWFSRILQAIHILFLIIFGGLRVMANLYVYGVIVGVPLATLPGLFFVTQVSDGPSSLSSTFKSNHGIFQGTLIYLLNVFLNFKRYLLQICTRMISQFGLYLLMANFQLKLLIICWIK